MRTFRAFIAEGRTKPPMRVGTTHPPMSRRLRDEIADAVERNDGEATPNDILMWMMQDMDQGGTEGASHRKELQDIGIRLGVYLPRTKQEIDRIVSMGRGKKYDFKRGDVFYVFDTWKPLMGMRIVLEDDGGMRMSTGMSTVFAEGGSQDFRSPYEGMTPEDRKEANRLFRLIMRVVPSSPRQRELSRKYAALMVKYGKWDAEAARRYVGEGRHAIPEAAVAVTDAQGGQPTYLYRWVPIKGYSASTMGNTYGFNLEFAVVVNHPLTGERMVADPFNPLKGQVLKPIGTSWKALAPLKPEGKITQKVIDAEIQRQRRIWVAWKRDPSGGLPDAHRILGTIMGRLVGREG